MKLKVICMLATCLSGGVQASGFALIEQNASGMGNAYAGVAASAEDASTVFFNPAGLTHIEGRQMALAAHVIVPSAKFSGTSSTALPIVLPTGTGGDAGETAFVPNAYYAMDVRPGIKFGLGLNAPFGLSTEYDTPWAGQAQAVKSELKTYNINPSLAWKVSDRVSLGVGLDWQRIEATLTSVHPLGIPVIMEGDDDSWGWNAGLLFDMGTGSRIGLAYRSSVQHRLEGTLTAAAATPVFADIELPASASLSYWRRLNSAWEILADASWTQWSNFKTLAVFPKAGGAALSSIQELWNDTWRYSLGLTYRPSREWSWRMGLAFDEAPVPDSQHRTARIPDNDRTWMALGGQYRWSPTSAVDFGYTHIFVRDSTINHTDSAVTLLGTYSNQIDILSVQYTHNF